MHIYPTHPFVHRCAHLPLGSFHRYSLPVHASTSFSFDRLPSTLVICPRRTRPFSLRTPCSRGGQTICDAYVDPDLSDKGGSPFVRYGRLVEEVEGVFGVRGLERKPECDVEASVTAAQVTISERDTLPYWIRGRMYMLLRRFDFGVR